MAQDWDIKARGEECSGCKMQFQDRQQYFSALVFGSEGYVREDYCGRCWMGGKKEATSAYSQWQGVFRPPPPPPPEALKKETAETLLRRLMEQDDGTKVNVIYILAVMLERKRILVEKDIQKREVGTKLMVYEHRKTAEIFIIPDPCLQLDQLEHVQIEVVDLLGRHDAAQIPGTETVDPAAPAGGGSAENGKTEVQSTENGSTGDGKTENGKTEHGITENGVLPVQQAEPDTQPVEQVTAVVEPVVETSEKVVEAVEATAEVLPDELPVTDVVSESEPEAIQEAEKPVEQEAVNKKPAAKKKRPSKKKSTS